MADSNSPELIEMINNRMIKSMARTMAAKSSIARMFAVKVIDPYKVLQVSRTAEFSTVKKAYYKLVSKYHPDTNDSPTANEIFKDILEAYEMIKVDKGLSTKQPLVRSAEAEEEDSFKSKRPYASQYDETFDREKEQFGNFDSAEFYYKASNEKYSKYAGRFPLTSRFIQRNVRGHKHRFQAC